jgi:hypothetical protein
MADRGGDMQACSRFQHRLFASVSSLSFTFDHDDQGREGIGLFFGIGIDVLSLFDLISSL